MNINESDMRILLAIKALLADEEMNISLDEAQRTLDKELSKPTEDIDTDLVDALLDIIEDEEQQV